MHDKIAWLIKHIPFIQWVYQKVMSLVFRVMGLFISVDNKLVLLSSYGGDQYSDSPKVLFEAMKADPRFTGYRYVWAFGNPEKFDAPGADKVKIDTLSYFKTALRAKVWITNVNIERGLHFKKKSQIYLNTWHGNHVLEHVDDFRAALKEMKRILRSGGSFICSFPMDPKVELLDEDPGVHTDSERFLRYGQNDHKRVFGMEADKFLTEAGFIVERIDGNDYPTDILPVIGPADYDINVLFRCIKPESEEKALM